jgi:hypothetical protein
VQEAGERLGFVAGLDLHHVGHVVLVEQLRAAARDGELGGGAEELLDAAYILA